jgi:hypothetical protein
MPGMPRSDKINDGEFGACTDQVERMLQLVRDDRQKLVAAPLHFVDRRLPHIAQPLLGRTARGDIDEREHRAVDAVFSGAVGQDAGEVPTAVRAFEFAFDQAQRTERFGGIVGELVVLGPVRDIEQRASNIGGDDAEDIGGARRVALDRQIAIDEDRADVVGHDEVLQVVVDLARLDVAGCSSASKGLPRLTPARRTITKAAPHLAGMALKNCFSASASSGDASIPTTGNENRLCGEGSEF